MMKSLKLRRGFVMPSQFTSPANRRHKKKLLLWVIATLVLLALLASLQGCSQQSNHQATLWPMDKTCNLHKESCTAKYEGAEATLKVSPHPIPIARPLGIEVALNGLNPTSVQLDISGINMYMGYNRVPLKSSKPNHWVGTSMLAFCTAEKMEWQITLMLKMADGKEVQIPYFLETVNRAQ
ncbi:hypothetical protein [Thiomicrorhabdus indica]|uniref:hypothetical protein n=1 Tax=Thiomicrorhabdus indica TaxID=2267253 RepID=UPI002AA65A5B|nr:hypothetical protein [Thiomicrorhabdus indica]